MLLGFGGISDQIGRRATMLAGLLASLAGALLFAVALDVWWVFAGRVLMGIGVGLAASRATAAILEFSSRERTKSAASVTMAALAIGFAAALLLGGALTEYGPWPTHLCLDTGYSPPHPAGCDVVLAASYGRRCGRRQALQNAVCSEGYSSGLRVVIDRHDGGLCVRRAGPIVWRPS